MKKFLAALLAVMLVMTTSITAFGADFEDVMEKIDSGIAYAFDGNYGKDGYDVSSSKNFNIYIKSFADTDKYEAAYLASVKEALDNGTCTGGTLALVVQNLLLLGEDVESFEGYNLVNLFTQTDVTAYAANPYYYTYAIETALYLFEDDYAKKLCDQYLTYYTMGTGTDFWGGYGTSPDDLAMFVIGIGQYADGYEAYIEDALKLLETYYTADGYSNYGANADSTAFALAAYSVVENKEKADEVYDLLQKFYDESTGGYKTEYDPYIATADAVFGMEYYIYISDFNFEEETTAPAETTTAKAKAETTTEKVKTNSSKTSPDTGSGTVMVMAFSALAILFAGIEITLSKKRKN